MDTAPLSDGGAVYLPHVLVQNYLDEYLFWDAGAGRLTITTPLKVIYITADETEYTVNYETARLTDAVKNIDGTAYLPQTFLSEIYGAEINYSVDTGIIVIDFIENIKYTAETTKKTTLRYGPDKKTPGAVKLPAGTRLRAYENDGAFVKVRTDDGFIGYLNVNDATHTQIIAPVIKQKKEPWRPDKTKKTVLAWDLVTNATAAASPDRRVANPGVNVLSPTWFDFNEEKMDGTLNGLVNMEYLDWARVNGLAVWPLVSDNYSAAVNNAVLTVTHNRERAVRQIVDYVDLYGFDGINIDFEQVRQADAPYFLQFLRELAPLLRQRGVVLSVDLYVPLYTKYYNRTEIAKTVDFIAVMAYDEHTYGSAVSGPAASLGFVETGIADTLLEAPADMVLLGLPFYTRVWREEEKNGKLEITLKNYGMAYTKQLFVEQNAEFVWLEDAGYYYAEFSVNEDGADVIYKTWLEDNKSIEKKLRIFESYGLAGVACWRRGLEDENVWDVIAVVVK